MSNIPEYSVSELSFSIKKSLETKFNRVRVRGEVSGLTKAKSGHLYFNLKDEDALLSSIIWRGKALYLDVLPEEGLEILAVGKVSTYSPRSNYNFIVDTIKIAGEGAILKVIEDRKKKLKKLGYFENSIKKKLPKFPKAIGIITSSSGVVIEDMKKKIKERLPSKILLWPVSVQGQFADQEISDAINGFNQRDYKPDVLIVARGGGSLEDLLAFNSEKVAEAIFGSKIPVISAVGHETDFSISDLVADVRASTPTAAADLVVPDRNELLKKLNNLASIYDTAIENHLNMKQYRLDSNSGKILNPDSLIKNLNLKILNEYSKIKNYFDNYFRNFEHLVKNLNIIEPKNKLENNKNKILNLNKFFLKGINGLLDKKSILIKNQIKILQSSSHERWLEKGFVLIKDDNNRLIKNVKSIKKNEDILIYFKDGKANAKVVNVFKKI